MKKSKVVQKVLATAMVLSFALTGVACGGVAGADSNQTTISVLNMGGGVGRVWLDEAFERFQASVAEKSYEEGKKGVQMEVEHTTNYTVDDIETAGYNIYFDESQANIYQFAQAGKLENITDIVTEGGDSSIASKISNDSKSAVTYNGEYYALPHYEIFPGLSYDVELFRREKLFIAQSDAADVEEHEAFGMTVNYSTSDADLSCGSDGKYGTWDDGLPSSLQEFLNLCDRMTSKGIVPVTVAGGHLDYSNYFISGLTAALSGDEAMKANFTFEGAIEMVTGYSDQPLFEGLKDSGIEVDAKKPNVATVEVTEETGYLTRRQSARYYAIVMMEIFEKAGWIHQDSYKPTNSHTNAQSSFVFSGIGNNSKIGMIMEGSHVMNEIRLAGLDEQFYGYTGRNAQSSEREIAWLPLPSKVYGSVAENQGRDALTVVSSIQANAYINANIRDEGVKQACKDFLKFLYSDAELKAFVATTGVTRYGISLEYDDSVLNQLFSYEKQLISQRNQGTMSVVSQGADNETYKNNEEFFKYGNSGAVHSSVWENVAYSCPLAVLRRENLGKNAKDVFNASWIDETAWTNQYYVR